MSNVAKTVKKKVMGAIMQNCDFSKIAGSIPAKPQMNRKMIKEMVENYNYDDTVKEKVDKMLNERHMAKAIVIENKHAMPNFKEISKQNARY